MIIINSKKNELHNYYGVALFFFHYFKISSQLHHQEYQHCNVIFLCKQISELKKFWEIFKLKISLDKLLSFSYLKLKIVFKS